MRDFTPEERELIANTPITIECFDVEKIPYSATKDEIDTAISVLENKRKSILRYRSKKMREVQFNFLIALLPSSYNVVRIN